MRGPIAPALRMLALGSSIMSLPATLRRDLACSTTRGARSLRRNMQATIRPANLASVLAKFLSDPDG